MKKSYSKIISIKTKGKSKVYDFTVKDTHRILANNFYTSNCHINHPDITDFVVSKNDLSKITGANISVKVSDEFMIAVEKDEDYILSWPTEKKQIKIEEQIPYNKLIKRDDGTYLKRIKAKDLWNIIVKQAHKNAEPGVMFWDKMINDGPQDMYKDFGFETKGTNPCVTGDTLIAVADGRNSVSIKQLVEEGKDIPVYCLNNKGQIEIQLMRNPRITGYNQPIYEVKFDTGDSIKCTGNHKIKLKNGSYKEAKNLKYGDSVHVSTISYSPIVSDKNKRFSNHTAYQISNEKLLEQGFKLAKKLGRLFSDNEWIEFAEKNNLPKFIKSFRGFNGIREFALYIATELGFEYLDKDPRIIRRYTEALQNGYNAKITDDNIILVEKTCEECGKKFWKRYDRREIGYCSITCSNNHMNKTTDTNKRRTNTINETYNKKGEDKTQKQLKIYSDLKFKLGRNPQEKEWINSCKEHKITYRLGTKYELKKYKEVEKLGENYNHKVISVKLIGYDTVYNGTVDKWHNFFSIFKPFNKLTYSKQFIINNLNCGEVGLSPSDSCRLGSINLFNFIDKPFTKRAKLNWDRLAKVARLSQRFMDDIVYLEEEKINVIINKIESDPEPINIKRTELETWKNVLDILKKGRRTGIGVLGLGDMFAALGIQYGTSKATKLAEDIQKCIAINSYRESIKLAKERGAFPIWNADLEASNPFLRRVISENFDHKEYDEYLKYGRRNIATMSIAPTGSLAILAQTTSGIEPVFKVFYRRRRKVNPGEENVNVTFVDQNGDSWEEYNVIHKPFVRWYYNKFINEVVSIEEVEEYLRNLDEKSLEELINESPWKGAESHSLDYIEKVTMQGKIQRWVDHSISVTHNLPEKITLEEVNDIYFHGWKSGCKGITIYREGSRSGVLLSKEEKENDVFIETKAPKRPRVLPSDYYVGKANGREFAIIIGRWIEEDGTETNKPYEVFAFENPPLKKNTTGKTVKVRKGHYKFINGEFEIPELQLAANRIEQRMLTLSASMLLRHGAPIKHVIHIIKKIDENISSFSSVVRRYLSKYIEEEVNGESCPHCGDKLIMQDGCVKCISPECGYSKCG